jgi:hypothetical protein
MENRTTNRVNNKPSTLANNKLISSNKSNKQNSNLNTRIKNVETNVSKNISNLKGKALQNIPIQQRLQAYTKGFTNLISGRRNNSNNNNNNNNSNKDNNINKTSPFDNPIVLGVILIISIGFIAFGIYKYFKSINIIIYGKTFYGTDLLNYTPLFNLNVPKIETCIDRCNKDTLCNGITYNDITLQCIGTSKGILREDTIEHQAWIKPILESTGTKSSKLIGYANSRKIVKNVDIPKPMLPHEFNYSFYLYIEDFYQNQGTWKHILHKGNDIPVNDIIKTKNWFDIVRDFPSQSIGVWVAPFNNNLRIAISTVKYIPRNSSTYHVPEYKHAFTQTIITDENNQPKVIISDKPMNPMRDTTRNLLTYSKEIIDSSNNEYKQHLSIDYIDIYRIPVKKLNHISVNFQGLTMELYINGNLYKIKELNGYPIFNDGNLFAMNSNTIDGFLIDLKFTPDRLPHNKILEQIANKSQLEEKIQKGVKGLNL